MNREELVKDVVDTIKLTGKNHVVLNWPPRTGKSMGTVELIKLWKCNKVLILGDRINTINQWFENIEKYNPELKDSVNISTYQSLHNLFNEFDCIVLDEADLAFTDNRANLLSSFTPAHWIITSGTMDSYTYESLPLLNGISDNNDYEDFTISIEQAVEYGILPKPTIAIIEIELDAVKEYLVIPKKVAKKTIKYSERLKHKDWDKKFNLQCSEKDIYQYYTDKYETFKKYLSWWNDPDAPDWYKSGIRKNLSFVMVKNKMLQYALQRKKIMASIKQKSYFKLESFLNEKNPGYRSVVFCIDTAQANFINEELSIHSKKADSPAQLKAFNDYKINHLICCKVLDRGKDLSDYNYSIFLQIDKKPNSSTQRAGRHFLSKNPIIYILCLKDTEDDVIVNNFCSQYRPSWVKRYKL